MAFRKRLPAVASARYGLMLGIIAALAAAAAGFGHRFGFWGYREGFAALGWIAWLGAAAALVSLWGIIRSLRRGGWLLAALAGLVLGIGTVWIPYQARVVLRASPPLADITTDTEHPPEFVAVLAVRAADRARNSTAYGPEKAALQARNYPDIKPLQLAVPPPAAFARALAALREEGLAVIAAEEAAGRIEATATTFWFGFRDDVVIRVRAQPPGSRVDIRSTSRVGRREAGTNAARVRLLARRIAAGG